MNNELSLSWKILLSIEKESIDYSTSNDLFNVRSGKTFIRKIGGFEKSLLEPVVLDPTNIFYNAISKSLKAGNFIGKKFPFIDENGLKINFNFRLHYLKYIVITATYVDSFSVNLSEISKLQDLKKHRNLFNLIKQIGGLIVSGNYKRFLSIPAPKIYPCTIVFLTSENTENILSDKETVEILTRHIDLRLNIVEDVINKNLDHQINSGSFLIDRQGVLCRIPFSLRTNKEIKKKFLSCSNLLELSLVTYKYLSNHKSPICAELKRKLHLLINHPELVISNSVTARKSFELFIKEFNLKGLLEFKKDKLTLINYNQEKKQKSVNFFKSVDFKVLVVGTILALLSYIYSISPLKHIVEDYFSNTTLNNHPGQNKAIESNARNYKETENVQND